MPRFPILLGLSALVLFIATPPQAAAQTDPAAQALIDRLRPAAGGSTRGIRMPAEPPPAREAAAPAAAAGTSEARPRPAAPAMAVARPPAPVREDTAPSVSITVNFVTGSAVLTPEALRALAPLGRAVSSPDLAPYSFRIEGHTDTVGSEAVNRSLSERRAAAVRDHLIQAYGVDPARLQSEGFGSSRPLVATPPQTPDPRNRRVQIVNIGS